MERLWTPTRAAGLARLRDFIPRMGSRYAGGRNFDPGPCGDANVSFLSPYVRRRLVGETELIAAAVAAHGERAERFVQQVTWRIYWKGWLEQRPAIWRAYCQEVARGQDRLATEGGLRRVFHDATQGDTGIDCFDAWARELVATGHLHNHVRMWFASIWIFTLRLPWALGAAFFLRHLLDGDPAVNTLSWRWVGGLHTRGKHYVARADNVARYTCGRFNPAGLLDEDPAPLSERGPPPLAVMPTAGALPSGEVALLLHDEDCWPESLRLEGMRVCAVTGLLAEHKVAPRVEAFARGAVQDAVARAAAAHGCTATLIAPADLPAWIDGAGLPVVTPWAPVGPVADLLAGLGAARLLRRCDASAWAWATAGFFRCRDRIPELLAALRDA